MGFLGFPYAGVDFFQELELYNNDEWWHSHADVYRDAIEQPFEALLAELAPAFGTPRVFPPRRDARRTGNLPPYKTHQGGVAITPGGASFYVHLDSAQLFAGGGLYRMLPDQQQRYRAAVIDEQSGEQLANIVKDLTDQGMDVAGESTSSDVPTDAPRQDLLRLTSLHAHRLFGIPVWLATHEAADRVREAWETARTLVEWFDAHVGLPEVS